MEFTSPEPRLMTLSTIGDEAERFHVHSFHGSEYISRLFEFKLELLATQLDLSPAAVLGRSVTLTLNRGAGSVFNGLVKSLEVGEINSNRMRAYTLVLVPWLWLLRKNHNCRVFQQTTTREIVTEILTGHGLHEFSFNGEFSRRRDYCVQFNESDFDFISRLLQEDGIAYYFEHGIGSHRLVFVDRNGAYPMRAGAELGYSHGSSPTAQITSWVNISEVTKTRWTLADYSFQQPQKNFLTSVASREPAYCATALEHYQYPGFFPGSDAGHLTQIRMEAEETQRQQIEARSNVPDLRAGNRVRVDRHEGAQQVGGYLVIAATHAARDTAFQPEKKANTHYQNHFHCIAAERNFRPPAEHKKPVMPGLQSAVVVGPPGEEIHTDAQGRIKIQFHWDRLGKRDEHSSCFVRVMQGLSGHQWGAQFLPRVGQEVIVDFIDGDPDRPVVVGSVFNARNQPPYTSPTQCGIRTRSTPGASSGNELRFEDKKGYEQLYLKAKKNLDVDVGEDASMHVQGNRSARVSANEASEIGGNCSIVIGGDHTARVDGHQSESIAGDLEQTVAGDLTLAINGQACLDAGRVVLTAGQQLVLKAGAAKIVLDASGEISISGNAVKIKGNAGVVLKGTSSLAV